MSAKHTPGPWRKGETGSRHIAVYGRSDREPICVFGMGDDDTARNFSNAEANARFVAELPALVRALETCISDVQMELDAAGDADVRSNSLLTGKARRLKRARAALARARGQ